MATVQRYVNTASSGGDGTTNDTSGATAAYASLSSWEANAGGSATDDYIVDCCGTAADTTGVTVDFATNITTGSVTIRGNRSHAAGFYTGNAVISTSHYRLVVGNVSVCLELREANTTVDGIQLEHGHSTGSRSAICLVNTTANSHTTIKNNRVRNTSSVDWGIGPTTGIGGSSHTRNIENNLVVGFDVAGISCRAVNFANHTWNVYHNTVYGEATADGIFIESGTDGTPVFNIKGNAIANSGTGQDIDASGVTAGTVNYADNATDQYNLGTTNEIDLGATTDAWTSPGTAQSSDFSVKNTSSALYNAVNPTLVSTDITGFTRDGTNHDVGAFEFQAAGGDITHVIGIALTTVSAINAITKSSISHINGETI